MSSNQNLSAVLEKVGAPVEIKSREIPTPEAGEIVVRNHYVASNPVDHVMQTSGFYIKAFPVVLGSDVSGVVHAVGPNVTKFKKGDRVLGYAHPIFKGGLDNGAYQTYPKLLEINTAKLPENVTFEQGAVFPMAVATSGIGIFAGLKIPRPTTARPTAQDSAFLVWSAGTSVGGLVVQIAADLGFRVYATASESHHAFLKSIGAAEVWDYKDPAVADKIVAAAKDHGAPIRYGYDAITKGSSARTAAEVLLRSGGKGGRLIVVLDWPEEAGVKPEGVEVTRTGAFRIATDQAELGAWLFNEYLPARLASKAIVPSPQTIRTIPGGIKATQEALDTHKAGVSGTKLVLKVE